MRTVLATRARTCKGTASLHPRAFCPLNVPQHADVWGSGGTAPCILKIGIRWSRLVTFTVFCVCPLGRARLMCPKTGLGSWIKRRILPCKESNPGRPSRSLTRLQEIVSPAELLLQCSRDSSLFYAKL
jgi:hypothetical protein